MPVRHDQPTLDMYLDLVSEHSTVPISRDNVTADLPSELPPGGARNTSVRIEAIDGQGLRGDRTTFYNRLDLGVELQNEDLTIIVPSAATNSVDCLDGLNERLGTQIEAQDIVSRLIENETVVFEFSDECYAYVGEFEVALLRYEDDGRPPISEAVNFVVYNEYPLPSNDYSQNPTELLLGLVNQYNGTSLSSENVFFDIPRVYEEGVEDVDTFVELRTTMNCPFKGSVTIYYNRLDLETVFPDGLEIPYGTYTDLVSALPAFNAEYSFDINEYDIVNATLSATTRMKGARYSLLLKPDVGPLVTIGESPEPLDVFNITSLSGDDMITLGGENWVTVPVTKDQLQLAIEDHCASCSAPGGCPPVQTRACEMGQAVMDNEAATQTDVNEATARILASIETETETNMGTDLDMTPLDNNQGAFYSPEYAPSDVITQPGDVLFINTNTSGVVGIMPTYGNGIVRNRQIKIGIELGLSFVVNNGSFVNQSAIRVEFLQGTGLLSPFPPMPEGWEESLFDITFSSGESSGGHNGIRVSMTKGDGSVEGVLMPAGSRNEDVLLVFDSINRKVGVYIGSTYYVLGNWTGTVMMPRFTLVNQQAAAETLDTRLNLRTLSDAWQGSYPIEDLTDLNGASS